MTVLDDQILAVKCRISLSTYHKVSEKTLAKIDAEIARLDKEATSHVEQQRTIGS